MFKLMTVALKPVPVKGLFVSAPWRKWESLAKQQNAAQILVESRWESLLNLHCELKITRSSLLPIRSPLESLQNQSHLIPRCSPTRSNHNHSIKESRREWSSTKQALNIYQYIVLLLSSVDLYTCSFLTVSISWSCDPMICHTGQPWSLPDL